MEYLPYQLVQDFFHQQYYIQTYIIYTVYTIIIHISRLAKILQQWVKNLFLPFLWKEGKLDLHLLQYLSRAPTNLPNCPLLGLSIAATGQVNPRWWGKPFWMDLLDKNNPWDAGDWHCLPSKLTEVCSRWTPFHKSVDGPHLNSANHLKLEIWI